MEINAIAWWRESSRQASADCLALWLLFLSQSKTITTAVITLKPLSFLLAFVEGRLYATKTINLPGLLGGVERIWHLEPVDSKARHWKKKENEMKLSEL